jgi:hypothetical protein
MVDNKRLTIDNKTVVESFELSIFVKTNRKQVVIQDNLFQQRLIYVIIDNQKCRCINEKKIN